MIRLDKITLREIHLPLVDPFRTSRGAVDARRVILLELTDHDGITAWSECVAENVAGYSLETVDTCWKSLTDNLGPAIVVTSFGHARDLHEHLANVCADDRMARAAIEMGCWGIQSIQANTSLAELLADECNTTPRSTVEAGIALGMFPTLDELASRCRAACSEGYRRIKIKIEPGHDIEPARTAISAVDGQLPVSVDANGSYSFDDLQTLRALDDLGLLMIEQPLPADDFSGHARLQSLLRTAICLDESITDVDDVNESIELDSAKVMNLKPGRVGGFTESLAIHNRCVGAAIPLWVGGMLETGIGRAYNVAVASLPNFSLPGDLSPSSRYWKRDIITEPWMMTDGTLKVPLDKPGIGVEIDKDLIDHITVRSETISSR